MRISYLIYNIFIFNVYYLCKIYLIPVIHLHSLVFKEILQSCEIVICDVIHQGSEAQRHHRITVMKCLKKKSEHNAG